MYYILKIFRISDLGYDRKEKLRKNQQFRALNVYKHIDAKVKSDWIHQI